MFIGINSSTRRRVMREALLQLRSGPAMLSREDAEEIESILREINAAETFGKLPVTNPVHEEKR